MNSERTVSSINLCPINFKIYTSLKKQISNIDALLLLSKIKFHQTNSKIKGSRHNWIARSREQLSAWYGFSTKKVDRLLKELTDNNLIEKKVGLWYGEKKIFIASKTPLPALPVNHKLFDLLLEQAGSVAATIIFSKIAFSFANTTITQDSLKWCCITEKELAETANISLRTLDKIINNLEQKGLIIKRQYMYYAKRKTHFHIPLASIETLLSQVNNKAKDTYLAPKAEESKDIIRPKEHKKYTSNGQKYDNQPANLSISINNSSNQKENNNITHREMVQTANSSQTCHINFNQIQQSLSKRQMRYLEGAINNTVIKYNLTITNPSLLKEEIIYAILNQEQHKNIFEFRHVVSKIMKILSSRNWRTPFGFYQYSESGIKHKKWQEAQVTNWEKQKNEEINQAHQNEAPRLNADYQNILSHHDHLTDEAIKKAKKILEYTKEQSVDQNNSTIISQFVDQLATDIGLLLKQGADKQKVLRWLR